MNFFQNKLRLVVLLVGIYLVAGGIGFSVFSFWHGKKEEVTSPISVEPLPSGVKPSPKPQFTGPKDQECPINGQKYTKEEKAIWEKRLPLLVMIENHKDSRPQSGLNRADIIYEAVAEGGITRLMGVYYCGAVAAAEQKYDLGPVRSARTYFLDWASEYTKKPLYVHVGGAGLCADDLVDPRAKALCQIEQYGWKGEDGWNDMDQFALPYKACRREPERTGQERATEHTMYCDTTALWEEAQRRELAPTGQEKLSWRKFKDDAPEEKRGQTKKISFYFWKGYQDYNVTWDYNSAANTYERTNDSEKQIDFVTKEPVNAKSVVIQFSKETGPVDDSKHMLYQTIGQGQALIFQDGGVISATWRKDSRTAPTLFYDLKGKLIEFVRGRIWIEVLPIGNQVDYESE